MAVINKLKMNLDKDLPSDVNQKDAPMEEDLDVSVDSKAKGDNDEKPTTKAQKSNKVSTAKGET